MQRKKWLLILTLFGAILFLISPKSVEKQAFERYGQIFKTFSIQHDISWSFIMALYVMECVDTMECGGQYDKTVFQELKNVRAGKLKEYKDITAHHVVASSNDALRELATSWGPFQIRGYRAVPYGITISQLKSEKAVEYSILWIAKAYGALLKKYTCQEMFLQHIHYHSRVLTTISSLEYASQGCKYMEWFAQNEQYL